MFVIPVMLIVEDVCMNVSLTPELEALVAEKVESGRYTSASEVIREALRLLEEQDQLRQKRLLEVKRKIDRGLEQLERGEGIPGDQARSRLRRDKKK
jgi:antitoxin ParD1/3/4